jgi:hypothetical protein
LRLFRKHCRVVSFCLFMLILLLHYCVAVLVNAYDDQWMLLDSKDSSNIVASWNGTGLLNARFYLIGTRPTILRVKQLFGFRTGGEKPIIPMILATAELTRIRDTSVMIEISDWGLVATGPLCSQEPTNCTMF